MNFSRVYTGEAFARNPHFVHLDCTHLQGTDCYCDDAGTRSIKRLIAPFPANGIHFIDSGDYHYVTKFWTEKITQPFSLVLFDHHTDMQPPQWCSMLSCGGWVKDMIDENPLLQHVYMMGIPERFVSMIPEAYQEKVSVCTDEQLHARTSPLKPLMLGEPLYISIDKDVLNADCARTNWEQGILTLSDLKQALLSILRHEKIIGIDICGECPVAYSLLDADNLAIDNKANSELLYLFKQQGLY